jgi:dTDP-4-dehydrorhamnose 3,5-epimerase
LRFEATGVEGAFFVRLDVKADERGSFARTYCRESFAEAGVDFEVVQTNVSHNLRPLTLRGLHYQAEPHGEPKLVHCVAGEVFDVAVDLRPASPTYLRWAAATLSPASGLAFFIPSGCAHGFLTLKADSSIAYLMGAPFVAECGRGVRWNDPAFSIRWPAEPAVISDRDANLPSLRE